MQIVSTFCLRQLFVSACLFLFGFSVVASAQQVASPSPSPSPSDQTGVTSTQSTQPLDTVTVIGQLNEARDQIVPDLGATKYSIGQTQIQSQSQGDNAPFNQTILPRILLDKSMSAMNTLIFNIESMTF
jgi:hypothetical protein